MSITDANLMIEHSSAECDPDYVKSKFDQIFGPDFVIDVIEEVITADTKKFYLIVDQDHPALMRFTDLIHENKFAAVVYKKEWNKTTRTYTEVYWKVFSHYPVFTPYLANEEKFAEMFRSRGQRNMLTWIITICPKPWNEASPTQRQPNEATPILKLPSPWNEVNLTGSPPNLCFAR